jgi:VWFA-related protein
MRQVIAIVSAVCFATAASHAQSGSPQKPTATFKADVNLVEVHAVVTNERGEFVGDLSKDDFEVYESGRLQPATVFQLVDAPVPNAAPRPAELLVEPDVRGTASRFEGRLYVLVLDDLHTTTLRSHLVRGAARRFVERHLADGDLAAIVYTSGRTDAAQELTPSRRLLLAAVDRFQGQKLPSATKERLAVHLNDRENERAIASSSGDDSGVNTSSSSSAATRTDDPYDSERGMNAQRALGSIRSVAQWMSDVPGRRKSLVLFSEGIDYDIYDVFANRSASAIMQDARDAIAAAQRANVTIYAVDPRGLTDLGDEAITIASLSDDPSVDYGTSRGFQRELLMAQESLITLAEETGGIAVVRNNDVAGGLTRVVRDTSRYYVIGYVTDPSVAPGKLRKIEVKVRRPGLKVRARRGYVPPDARSAAKRAAEIKPGTSPALVAALTNPVPVGDVPVRVWAAPFRGAGKLASVALAVEIDGTALKYQQRDDRFLEDLELSVIAADEQGKVRGSDRQTLNLKLKPETHRMLMTRGGVRMLSRIELPPSRYQLRIGVHESNGGAVGTVPIDLEVPDYAKLPFTMSGLVLTSSEAAALVTPRPDAVLKDVFPTPPVAARTFGADGMIGVFAELYDRSTPSPHDVDFRVSVRPAAGGAAVFSSTETRSMAASGSVRTHGYKAEVPLKDLAPGGYVVRVEAVSRVGGHAAHREVPITVRPRGASLTW